jgi:hypothetical protein
VCDSPDQEAHYHTLGPKLGASLAGSRSKESLEKNIMLDISTCRNVAAVTYCFLIRGRGAKEKFDTDSLPPTSQYVGVSLSCLNFLSRMLGGSGSGETLMSGSSLQAEQPVQQSTSHHHQFGGTSVYKGHGSRNSTMSTGSSLGIF